MAQSNESEKKLHVEIIQTGIDMVQMASNSKEGQLVAICRLEPLNECEEPDVGKLLVRFCGGLGYN